MSKTKTVGGKDYRWDYKNKKWVESHGASGGEALGRLAKGAWTKASSLFKKKPKKSDALTKNTKKENKSTTKSKTPVSDHAKTGHTKLVKGPDGKVRRVKISNTTKDKTLKGSDTSKMKVKDQGDGGRADWLKKTRNSPAAKSGAFTDEERWQQQLRHRAWKEGRKKKKSTPKPTPKAEPKAKATPKKKKKKQDLNFTTM